jgi:general secretion pathway protein J
MSGFARPLRSGCNGGFTLVEVVVALSLLSLLMLGLLAALRTFGDTLSRADDRIVQVETLWAVSRLLHQTIATAAPVQDAAASATTRPTLLFQGRHNELRWIGNMPARYGSGGLHHMRLVLDQQQSSPVLLLEYLPFLGAAHGPDWLAARTHRLMENVHNLSFQYQSTDEAEWSDTWIEADRLPARVRVDLDPGMGTMNWPLLVVSLRASAAAPGGPSIGNRGR